MGKGPSSILFEFGSIVDKEISLIRFMQEELREMTLDDFDKYRLINSSIEDLKFHRILGVEDLFKSMLIEEKKDESDSIFNELYDRYGKAILEKYACPTSLHVLINAYKNAADGLIKTGVHCSNTNEINYIRKTFEDKTKVILGDRKSIDTSDYGRIIVGDYREALEYNFEAPKSIVVMNFRENFTSTDMTTLQIELLTKLGDIHTIEVMTAFDVKYPDEIASRIENKDE